MSPRIFLLLAACAPHDPPASPLAPVGERFGLVLSQDAYGDGATRLVYLDQGWGPPETLWFYHADQGSVLLPYETLVHLEQATSEAPFLAPDNVSRYRLLPERPSVGNPDGLPIGFARHGDSAGLTCAACHTTQINYKGTAVRIDGAPTLADIDGLLRGLQASMEATLADPAKLARFAAATKTDAAAARASLTETLGWFQSYTAVNHPKTQEGYGRLDAVGRIINQTIRFTSGPEHSLEPSAPASYPFVWDAPRHDFVQWTAFSPNAGAGSLGRNAGEVVGVFGRIEVKHYETEEDAKRGYPSTVETNALVSMEESLRGLQSPVWPDAVLPAIDTELAKRGATIYARECESCHAILDRDDPTRKVTAMVTGLDVVGTDPTAVTNLLGARAPSGVLEGAISPRGERYPAEVPALDLLGDLVTRTVSAHPDAAVRAIANAKLHGLEESPKQGRYTQATDADPLAPLRAYKARPLNGIWATSPYLHNGSVPTLHDLLLPAADRPTTFTVGRFEYDPVKVGYVTEGGPFVLDTRLPGNSNAGHTWGTSLAEDDRRALVEYLKGL